MLVQFGKKPFIKLIAAIGLLALAFFAFLRSILSFAYIVETWNGTAFFLLQALVYFCMIAGYLLMGLGILIKKEKLLSIGLLLNVIFYGIRWLVFIAPRYNYRYTFNWSNFVAGMFLLAMWIILMLWFKMFCNPDPAKAKNAAKLWFIPLAAWGMAFMLMLIGTFFNQVSVWELLLELLEGHVIAAFLLWLVGTTDRTPAPAAPVAAPPAPPAPPVDPVY